MYIFYIYINIYIYIKELNDKIDKELNGTIKSVYPEDSEDIKNEIINRNLTLKITLNERRVKKWRKFKQKKRAFKSRKGSSKVSDFVEIALKRSQFQTIDSTEKSLQRIKQKIKKRS